MTPAVYHGRALSARYTCHLLTFRRFIQLLHRALLVGRGQAHALLFMKVHRVGTAQLNLLPLEFNVMRAQGTLGSTACGHSSEPVVSPGSFFGRRHCFPGYGFRRCCAPSRFSSPSSSGVSRGRGNEISFWRSANMHKSTNWNENVPLIILLLIDLSGSSHPSSWNRRDSSLREILLSSRSPCSVLLASFCRTVLFAFLTVPIAT